MYPLETCQPGRVAVRISVVMGSPWHGFEWKKMRDDTGHTQAAQMVNEGHG